MVSVRMADPVGCTQGRRVLTFRRLRLQARRAPGLATESSTPCAAGIGTHPEPADARSPNQILGQRGAGQGARQDEARLALGRRVHFKGGGIARYIVQAHGNGTQGHHPRSTLRKSAAPARVSMVPARQPFLNVCSGTISLEAEAGAVQLQGRHRNRDNNATETPRQQRRTCLYVLSQHERAHNP